VPAGLLELWSKRTAHITAEATPKIAEYEALLRRTLTAAEKITVVKTAVLKTRTGKQHPELSVLHATWTAEAEAAGWTQQLLPGSVREAGNQSPPLPEPDVSEAGLVDAVRAAGLRRAAFSRADLAGQVAARLPTSGLTALEVTARVEQLTDTALGLTETVELGDHPRGVTERASDARYATVQVLAAEARVLSLAARARRVGYGQVGMTELMAHGRAAGMDPAQYTALLHLAGDGDFLSVLTAPAGAGKTHTLGAPAAVWSKAGRADEDPVEVVGCVLDERQPRRLTLERLRAVLLRDLALDEGRRPLRGSQRAEAADLQVAGAGTRRQVRQLAVHLDEAPGHVACGESVATTASAPGTTRSATCSAAPTSYCTPSTRSCGSERLTDTTWCPREAASRTTCAPV